MNKLTSKTYSAIIFDLDGTLINSITDIGNSMNTILQKFGFPTHEIEKYKTFVGDGVEFLTKRVLPVDQQNDNFINQCIELFKNEYRQNWNCNTKLYPGIADFLDELEKTNIPLAILTNKPHEFTLDVVDELLYNWTFEAIQGVKVGCPKKPDPASALEISRQFRILPENILFVGDSDVDMKTAINAGMQPVGVSWGFRSKAELLKHGAKTIVDSPKELLRFLRKI